MKLNKKNVAYFILYLVLLFPFFPSEYINLTTTFGTKLYFVLKVFAFFYALLYILRTRKISKFTTIVTLSQLFLLVITYLKNGNVVVAVENMVTLFTICVLVESGLKQNLRIFFKAFITLLTILITINFFTILRFPSGIYLSTVNYDTIRHWFLGNKNSLVLYVLLLLFLMDFYQKITKSSHRMIFVLLEVEAISSLVLCWSATGVVGILLYLFGKFFEKRLTNLKFCNMKNAFFTYIALFISIVVMRFQNIFSYFIVDILKRDITFTGRTYIWDYIMKCVKGSPFIGYGVEYTAYRYSKSLSIRAYSHNQLLEFLYQGGALYIGLIIIMIIMIYKKLKQNKNHSCYFLIGWTIFCYLMMMLTEYYSFSSFIYIFCFAYHIDLLKE